MKQADPHVALGSLLFFDTARQSSNTIISSILVHLMRNFALHETDFCLLTALSSAAEGWRHLATFVLVNPRIHCRQGY